MKKVLTGLLVLALMLAFVACDSNTKPTPKPEPAPEPEKQVIYIPGFELTAQSKGMTGFPDEIPFLDEDWNVGKPENHTFFFPISEEVKPDLAKFYLASNAMSNLPLLPALKRYEENPESFAEELEERTITLFGFTGEVLTSKVNDDGIYLFVVAYEKDSDGDDKTIAIVEYYYSWKTKTFSYREIVMLTLMGLKFMGNPQPGGNSILLFELNDVPVEEKDGIISFSAGVNDDGSLNEDTMIKQYRVSLPSPNTKSESIFFFTLDEYHSLLNHKGKLVSSVGYESYRNEYSKNNDDVAKRTVFPDLLGDFFTDTNKAEEYNFYYDEDNQQVTLDDDLCNIDFAVDVLSYLFKGFDAFETEESFKERVDGIESLDDFDALKYEFKTEAVKNYFRGSTLVKDIHFPVMFNVEEKIGTTSDFLDSGLFFGKGGSGWGVEQLAAFKDEKLFGLEFDTRTEFALLILQQCGLSKENAEALLPTSST